MNKKRLSVVMAGAMLASAVAPVLAAEVTPETMGSDQRGLVMEGIRNLMKSKMLDGTVDTDDSAYGFTVVAKGESDKNTNGTLKVTLYNNLADINTQIKTLTDTSEKTIRVYEKETRIDEAGKLTDTYKEGAEKPGSEQTATVANLANLIGDSTVGSGKYKDNKFVDKVEYVEGSTADKGVKITLNVSVDANTGSEEKKTITLLPGEKLLNLSDPRDKNDYKLSITNEEDVQKFDHFAVATTPSGSATEGDELPGRTLVQEINLVKAADVKDAYKVEDLFDGLMLTEKGVELLETLKADETGKDLDYTYKDVTTLLPGIYGFNIEVTDKNSNDPTKVIKTITVRGLNKKDADILESWIQAKKFNVGVLAGANRYETAAKIAKEQADLTSVAKAGNIVLVNGEALVDGLSAAPLAWSLGKNSKAAPILLTKSNTLPKETKEYLKELVKAEPIQDLEKMTIHIVGGEAVVTESVVEELEDYGFKVKRHGGENREETSLEVLDELQARRNNTIYIVGADGEADAMSVAPVASENKGAIVVAKKGGLSKAAYKEIERSKGDIKIIGGESVISSEEESKLKEIAKENGKTVERISGKNRQATNAAIMKKFYTFSSTSNVVVAKDGQKKKMDLVDALTAANLASQKKAPVVLATDKLSNDQLNEVNKLANNVEAIYQIGHGVERSVVAKLAELLGLPKAF